MTINPAATLAQAIEWVQKRRDDGVSCPCCGQLAKTYRRNVNAGMAQSLIAIYQVALREALATHVAVFDVWVHVPTQIGARSREEGKLAYWGLVEEQLAVRPDGGRAGYWRITPRGMAFVLNQTTVQKYALVYDGRCLSHDGPQVDIKSALGSKFSYSELMSR